MNSHHNIHNIPSDPSTYVSDDDNEHPSSLFDSDPDFVHSDYDDYFSYDDWDSWLSRDLDIMMIIFIVVLFFVSLYYLSVFYPYI